MAPDRPAVRSHRVRGAALDALAALPRLELVEAFQQTGPATVDELAAVLERPPKTLYRPLKVLVEAGLVVEDGSVPTETRPATRYRLIAERLELDPEDRSPRARAARDKLARAILGTALRLHAAALADGDVELGGPRRSLTLGHRVARLTPEGLSRVNAKLSELYDLLGTEHDPRGRAYVLTLQLAPDRPRRRPPRAPAP